jgi:hypothetical protein
MRRSKTLLAAIAVVIAFTAAQAAPAFAAHQCSIYPFGTALASNATSCQFAANVARKWINGAHYRGDVLVTVTRAIVISPVTHRSYRVGYRWNGHRWGGSITAWTSGVDSWVRFTCYIDPPGNG